MRRAIGQITPAVRRPVLLIVAAIEVTAPAPFFRADDKCGCIVVLDHRGVIQNSRLHLIHRCAGRMHVAMGRVPDAWFVIEQVITQAAVRVRAPLAHQVLHPGLLKH